MPTADRIANIFNRNIPEVESSTSDDSDEGELEEMDFSDMARIREVFDIPAPLPEPPEVKGKLNGSAADSSKQANNSSLVLDHEVESTTRYGAQLSGPTDFSQQSSHETLVVAGEEISNLGPTQMESTHFFVDTSPAPVLATHGTTSDTVADGPLPLGHEATTEPEEIIVYVAPHPRSGKIVPAISLPPSTPVATSARPPPTQALIDRPAQKQCSISPAPSFDTFSFSFANSPNPKKQPWHPPIFTSGALSNAKLKIRKKAGQAAEKKVRRQAMFGSFGAIMQEAHLRGQRTDPRWEQRRRDDSDIDWGDEDSGGEGRKYQDAVDELSNGVGAMDLDPDLDLDVEALKRFTAGMSANGGRFVTMDDIADEQRMRLEDEEGQARMSSGDEDGDGAVSSEGRQVIAESRDESSSEESVSSDDSASPRSGFQKRLERLRRQARSKRSPDVIARDSSDDEDVLRGHPSKGDLDEEFIAHIEVNLILPLQL